ncbi:MAG: phosphate acyltransferase PlsX [Deltaproteobacteria bacterium]|nr:phosphate acyltransferase PlsX [Deltaproteobacteria bacterium]
MLVAVDAMGGDNAPDVVVQGALQASIETGIDIALVGDEKAISAALKGRRVPGNVSIHHCDEAVLMGEAPLKALRNKRGSSIMKAFDLLKTGKVDAVVSAGNSGATMAAGILKLGKIEGVERPAIACIMPGEKGSVIIIDVGGNVDCRPVHLLQFGVMANAFALSYLGMQAPTVGLLNIGREEGKGNEQIRSAYNLLRDSGLHFIGNVEGGDILSGESQIVLCDGLIGNIVLKMAEGIAESISIKLKREIKTSIPGRAAAIIGRSFFRRFERSLDYAEWGGAPILGIKGVGIVCHGRSSARAIRNAVMMAVTFVENHVQDRLCEQMVKFHA